MNPHLQPLIDHLKQLPALPPFEQLKGLLADLVTDDRTRKLLLLAAEKQVLQVVLNCKEAPDAVFRQQKIKPMAQGYPCFKRPLGTTLGSASAAESKLNLACAPPTP